MNRLSNEERARIVAALVEGASINSTVRMTGISKPTILKLLKDLGTACQKYQDKQLRNLPCRRVQCDEIWSFCFGKDKKNFKKFAREIWLRVCLDLDCYLRRY